MTVYLAIRPLPCAAPLDA
ncbi:hypothetical protein CGLO_14920 [Colletotrichum gloeosporioides Cg-14]|uniref:Uncharacterized protein n=1 Tax=Colletotrichum gloeosporioides (strain Cg-14) TaxID=1237896 RepID=T0K2X5_COLGC|nr:hypothetical protein CGLO_14920 [Colletotrichum gloeosporioides Cg-14]